MDEVEKNTKRVTDLESSLMHLQSEFDSLNEIVLDNALRLDKLTAMIQRVTDRLDAPAGSDAPGIWKTRNRLTIEAQPELAEGDVYEP